MTNAESRGGDTNFSIQRDSSQFVFVHVDVGRKIVSQCERAVITIGRLVVSRYSRVENSEIRNASSDKP